MIYNIKTGYIKSHDHDQLNKTHSHMHFKKNHHILNISSTYMAELILIYTTFVSHS